MLQAAFLLIRKGCIMNISCGIDFGTTNSSIAIGNHQVTPKLIKVEKDSVTIPSALFFGSNKKRYLGREAIRRYTQGEQGRFMRSLKRVLGTELMSTGTYINGKLMKFEEILALFLKSLKEKAEEEVCSSIEDVVMGRPVHFRDNDEKGDRQAQEELYRVAKMVGFKNIDFQYEPIAAAFTHETKLNKELLACVVDIGGGTSDFTVIRLGPQCAMKKDRKDDILASTGVRIGGNDFDRDLSMKSFMPEFGLQSTYGEKNLNVPTSPYFDLSEWSQVNAVYSHSNLVMIRKILMEAHDELRYKRLLDVVEQEKGHLLLSKVEEAKIDLTDSDKIKVLFENIAIEVLREDLEGSIHKDVSKVSTSLKECVKLAGIKPRDIQLVILTGGSTEVPYVQEVMCSHFMNAEVSQENKLASVGLGLAYDSIRRF